MTLNCPRKTTLLSIALVGLLAPVGAHSQSSTPAPPAQSAPPAGQAPTQQQTPGANDQGKGIIKIRTNTVVVPVTVKDSKGNLVGDLQRSEFRIFEDGVEQTITKLDVNVAPLSIVILIDNDLKQKDADQVEPSLRAIVGGMSTSDEAFVCRFDQFFHEGTGFIRDQDKLITQLKRVQLSTQSSVPPPGDTFNGPTINGAPAPGAPQTVDPSLRTIKGQPSKALDDAVYNAAELLKARPGETRRKIILLISDGQNGAKFNTHSYKETRDELLRHEISVYSVATGSSYFDRKFSRLVDYAHDTGGDVFFGAKENAFSDFYSQITEEARNQYTLYFEPKGDRKVDYHQIEVRVRREGLKILAREGYYGGTFATPQ